MVVRQEVIEERLKELDEILQELRKYQERIKPLEEKIGNMQAIEAKLAAVQKERDELLSVVGDIEMQMKKTSQDLQYTSEQNKKAQKTLANIRSIICTEE